MQKHLLTLTALLLAVGASLAPTPLRAAGAERLNVLLITADDMNYNTPGVTGCITPDITPNLDRFAREGVRFVNAHVAVAVCQPSRECLMTGRFPHRNGATGFYPVRSDVPTLPEVLKAAGYRLGILGKVAHLKPDEKFPWDYKYDAIDLGNGRDPAAYFRHVKQFLADSKGAGQPFFLMANSHDPHRPWAGSEAEKNRGAGKKGKQGKKAKALDSEDESGAGAIYPSPKRIYKPEEVTVPGFLPDLPDVRKEMAQYYSSAHRCDETIGEILRALQESGMSANTLVMFLSDNGISMPFAKSNCYLSSTRTPWMIRWPGKVPSRVDSDHFISGTDFMPTVLDAAGLQAPPGMDGRSFLPLLKGADQPNRDRVFTCYNDTSGRGHYPMRCLQTKQFGYIFNDWSDGKTVYRSEPMGGIAYRAMQAAATDQPAVAKRVELLLHRVPEEFYDFAADPSALRNLISDPKHTSEIEQMRKEMRLWMEQTQDPLLESFKAKTTKRPQT